MATSKSYESAANLAFAWRRSAPMTTEDEVRRAVEASGQVAAEDVADVVEILVPLLREDGLFVDA